jgi:hypothetical protein
LIRSPGQCGRGFFFKSEYARVQGRQRRYIKGQKYTLLSRKEKPHARRQEGVEDTVPSFPSLDKTHRGTCQTRTLGSNSARELKPIADGHRLDQTPTEYLGVAAHPYIARTEIILEGAIN